MKALSIRQPWAWLIVRPDLVAKNDRDAADLMGEIKDIENRTWHTKFRGRFLVHAAQGMTLLEYNFVKGYLAERAPGIELPAFKDLQRGGIIGSVELVDNVTDSESLWYMGFKGFRLRDSKPLPFSRMKGRLGFFDVPSEILEALA